MRPRRRLAGTCVSEHSLGNRRALWEFRSCLNTPWMKREAVFRKSSPPPRGVNASSSPGTASQPAVQLVRCEHKRRGGFDWDRLNANRRRLGIKDAPPEDAEVMMAALHDSALSRRVLGLDEDG